MFATKSWLRPLILVTWSNQCDFGKSKWFRKLLWFRGSERLNFIMNYFLILKESINEEYKHTLSSLWVITIAKHGSIRLISYTSSYFWHDPHFSQKIFVFWLADETGKELRHKRSGPYRTPGVLSELFQIIRLMLSVAARLENQLRERKIFSISIRPFAILVIF